MRITTCVNASSPSSPPYQAQRPNATTTSKESQWFANRMETSSSSVTGKAAIKFYWIKF